MNIQKMMKQAQNMQKRMGELQEEMEKREVEGVAGGGVVRVLLTGKSVMLKVSIDDSLMEKSEKEMLEDLIVAAYHDQGIFPLKAMDYYGCVNITVGLPFVRVSPGHGTAEDIAGQGLANPRAMIEAIKWALKLGSV